MKKIMLLVFLFVLWSSTLFSDDIPENSHYVDRTCTSQISVPFLILFLSDILPVLWLKIMRWILSKRMNH